MDVNKIKNIFTSVNDRLPELTIDGGLHSIDLPCLIGDHKGNLDSWVCISYYKKDKGWIWRDGGDHQVNVLYWLDIDRLSSIISSIEWSATDTHMGREGCTYGDTDYDSLSVAYGYNLAMEHILQLLEWKKR